MHINTINTARGKTFHLLFSSVQDILNAPLDPQNAEKEMAKFTDPDASDFCSVKGESWYGVASKKEALDIIRGSGWEAGSARVMDAFRGLEASQIDAPRSIRRRKVWGEDGDTCDPDRLRNGQYDSAFQSTRRTKAVASGRIIRIFGNVGAKWQENASAVFWAGATALYLTDALENAGYRAEVYAANYATEIDRQPLLLTIPLKRSDEPASVDELAATLCLTGFLRTAVFRAYSAAPQDAKKSCCLQHEITEDALRAAEMHEQGDIIIPLLRNESAAREFIQKVIAGIGSVPSPDEDTEDALQSCEWTTTDVPYEEPEATRRSPRPAAKAPSGKQITATGDTYPVRYVLKAAGFTWNKSGKCWTADASSSAAQALKTAGLAGVTFTE